MENSWEIWIAGTIRLWAVLAVQPHWRLVTGKLWPFIAGIVALTLAFPELDANRTEFLGSSSLGHLGRGLGTELLFGVIMGVFAALPGYALVGSISQSEYAINGRNTSEGFRLLCISLILLLTMATNAHFPLLASLHEMLEIIPVGFPEQAMIEYDELRSWWDLAVVAELIHSFLLLGLSLATPVLAMACCIELVSSGLKKSGIPFASQWHVIHPWVRLAICLVGLTTSWRVFPSLWTQLEL